MGRALLRLGQITGDDRYSQVAHQLATFFKRSLYLEDGRRYVWGYRPILSDRKAGFPSTFWKADVDLGFAIDCYKAGVVFDDRDLKRFGLTLKEAVFRPGWVNCSISQYKRVVALDEKFDRVGVRGYGICGWMVLSEFDESIEAYINEVLYAHRHIMPRGWLGSPRAAFGFSLKQGQGVELTR
jgi:hypothetical protein